MWLAPADGAVQVSAIKDDTWLIQSTKGGLYTIESAQHFDAEAGQAFAVNVRLQVGIGAQVRPELVCFDAQGREIPIPSTLVRAHSTPRWQEMRRVFPVQPGTATVRARLRASGWGEIRAAHLEFWPVQVDPYETGALVIPPNPHIRQGVLLESNFGILNRELISKEDRDGDGKWALIEMDLDQATRPAEKGDDWRSSYEFPPNATLWSDGVVLKSDSVHEDRAPDFNRALHFRMKLHAGSYDVWMNDPGRAVAVSTDGRTWRRFTGGTEAALGQLAVADGAIELWIDACYRDDASAGPVYFDYVRLMPTVNAPEIDGLLAAARRKPGQIVRGSAEERRVPVTVEIPMVVGAVEDAETRRRTEGRLSSRPLSLGNESAAAPRQARGPELAERGKPPLRRIEGNWPVRCGLPVPQGDLHSADHVAVLDAEGRKVPIQSRTMATWPDGSVKWLYLDFQHELSRDAKANYTVAYGNVVRPARAADTISIDRTADGMEVDTGAIRFLVPRERFGIIENVRRADGSVVQREALATELVEADGKVWEVGNLTVEKIEVEQSGPLHAVIVVETKLAESGKSSRGFYHRARIHAYAGSPLVQVDYFVANTDDRPAGEVPGSMSSKVVVRSLSMKLKPSAAVSGVVHALGRSSGAGAVVQKSEELVLNSETGNREIKAHLPGWLAATLKDGNTLGVGIEALREQFPKALRWKSDELEIALWAPEGGDFDWIEGVGKTHRLSFYYGTDNIDDGALLAHGPVLALADPQWYTASGAFGWQVPAHSSGLPAVERNLASHIAGPVIAKVGLSFENYGDHSSGGYVKGTYLWDNNEYDLPAGCMVHFARTGDREALRLGLASALHYLDVDTIHYSSRRADWARAQHVHSHGTFGHHTAQGPDFSHGGYVQGLIWYSYFTGEPIGVQGAQGIADWALRAFSPGGVLQMERTLGHPLMTLTDVYEATWDEKYLRGAAQCVDFALKWEHPVRSGWLVRITETPAYYAGSPFSSGMLPAGLIKFNSWAQLPEVDRMLERVARWTLTEVWRPPGGILHKGGSLTRVANPFHIANQGRLMAYMYERTRDPLYLAVPQDLIVKAFGQQVPSFGTRSTGLVFNHLPWFLATLSAHGNPRPDPKLEVSAGPSEVRMTRGASTRINVLLENTGTDAMQDLRISFHPRLDFSTTPVGSIPEKLDPGQRKQIVFELTAPTQLNLTCDYNRIAYAHASMSYKRQGTAAHVAHAFLKVTIE